MSLALLYPGDAIVRAGVAPTAGLGAKDGVQGPRGACVSVHEEPNHWEAGGVGTEARWG
ncbi:hypothetical protein FRC08_001245 [Ceratobasidium sp. 394]|nr:hypothetical protein FRC08_001245 [Ceratobasidium sp. 394]